MDSDERAIVVEMQEQIAALQIQVEQIQAREAIALRALYLCTKFNFASCSPTAHTSWAARFKATGQQLSQLLPKHQ